MNNNIYNDILNAEIVISILQLLHNTTTTTITTTITTTTTTTTTNSLQQNKPRHSYI